MSRKSTKASRRNKVKGRRASTFRVEKGITRQDSDAQVGELQQQVSRLYISVLREPIPDDLFDLAIKCGGDKEQNEP